MGYVCLIFSVVSFGVSLATGNDAWHVAGHVYLAAFLIEGNVSGKG